MALHNLFRRTLKLYEDSAAVARHEFHNIITDKAVLLIFIGAVVVYPVLYSFAYSAEVSRKIPVAVVDQSHTPSSRQLARMFNQTETISVIEQVTGLEEAESEFRQSLQLNELAILMMSSSAFIALPFSSKRLCCITRHLREVENPSHCLYQT